MEKLIDLAALAEQLGGEEWVYSRTSLHSRGYITGKGGRTIVQTTDGDVPANVCRFIQMADPATILAIAKAYRALEQINAELRRQRAGLTKEANDFEAKLEDLAKQKPRYQIQKKPSYGRESVWIDVASREEAETNVLHGYRWRMVYDAPAPAADLVELVPCCLVDAMSNLGLEGVSIGDKSIIGKAIEVLHNIQERTK